MPLLRIAPKTRERALKVVLVIQGVLSLAEIYFVAIDLRHLHASDPGDTMMYSQDIALGIFLLLAVRNPSAYRNLILYTAWSGFAHAVVMSALAFGPSYVNDRAGYWGGSAFLVVSGLVWLALLPPKASRQERADSIPVTP